MKNSTMRFVLNNGEMTYVAPKLPLVSETNNFPMAMPSYILDIPNIKSKIKGYMNNSMFALAPVTTIASKHIFYDSFLHFIFPFVLDIGKCYCIIKIAQSFYEEQRVGRMGGDGGSGMGAVLKWGKWYLCLMLLPIVVELIDGVGSTMFTELRNSNLQ